MHEQDTLHLVCMHVSTAYLCVPLRMTQISEAICGHVCQATTDSRCIHAHAHVLIMATILCLKQQTPDGTYMMEHVVLYILMHESLLMHEYVLSPVCWRLAAKASACSGPSNSTFNRDSEPNSKQSPCCSTCFVPACGQKNAQKHKHPV